MSRFFEIRLDIAVSKESPDAMQRERVYRCDPKTTVRGRTAVGFLDPAPNKAD